MAKENSFQHPYISHYLLKDSSYSLILVSFYHSKNLLKASFHIHTTITHPPIAVSFIFVYARTTDNIDKNSFPSKIVPHLIFMKVQF